MTSDETIVEQGTFVVPNIPIKELLDAIPYVDRQIIISLSSNATCAYRSQHCFKRSALRSSAYVYVPLLQIFGIIAIMVHPHSFWDILMIFAFYKTAAFLDTRINAAVLTLPHPWLYSFAKFALWSLYGFWAGLFATGLWVVAHECGHQAFSESKMINNTVGWILHSAYV